MNDFVNKRVDVMLLEMKFLKLAMLFCFGRGIFSGFVSMVLSNF
jgi:hypothetical protein